MVPLDHSIHHIHILHPVTRIEHNSHSPPSDPPSSLPSMHYRIMNNIAFALWESEAQAPIPCTTTTATTTATIVQTSPSPQLGSEARDRALHHSRQITPQRADRFPVRLDLLRAPAGISFPHVGRGLDGGDEFEDDVGDTDEADNGACDDAEDAVVEEDASDKDVDCRRPHG